MDNSICSCLWLKLHVEVEIVLATPGGRLDGLVGCQSDSEDQTKRATSNQTALIILGMKRTFSDYSETLVYFCLGFLFAVIFVFALLFLFLSLLCSFAFRFTILTTTMLCTLYVHNLAGVMLTFFRFQTFTQLWKTFEQLIAYWGW